MWTSFAATHQSGSTFTPPSSVPSIQLQVLILFQDKSVSMSTTCSQLARSFGIVVRQISDLLATLPDFSQHAPALGLQLNIGSQVATELHNFVDFELKVGTTCFDLSYGNS